MYTEYSGTGQAAVHAMARGVPQDDRMLPMSPVQIRPVGGAAGCLVMILVSVLLSVLLTVGLNLLLR